jgi:hypothetical protein
VAPWRLPRGACFPSAARSAGVATFLSAGPDQARDRGLCTDRASAPWHSLRGSRSDANSIVLLAMASRGRLAFGRIVIGQRSAWRCFRIKCAAQKKCAASGFVCWLERLCRHCESTRRGKAAAHPAARSLVRIGRRRPRNASPSRVASARRRLQAMRSIASRSPSRAAQHAPCLGRVRKAGMQDRQCRFKIDRCRFDRRHRLGVYCRKKKVAK